MKRIFNLFKKEEKINEEKIQSDFDINQTALILAYEVARSDGDIDEAELNYLHDLIDESKSKDIIIAKLKEFSSNNSSFYNHIKNINHNCSKDQKEDIIRVLWDVAYSDNFLDVHEERIVRRIADLLFIKDIRVLKIKDDSKNNITNN